MANLRGTRTKLRIVVFALVGLNVLLAATYVYFWTKSGSTSQSEFTGLRSQVQSKMKTVVPPNTVQQRVDEAQKQIDSFYTSRLPEQSSAIFEELGRVATENRVKLSNAHYDVSDTGVGNLRRITIDASLSGDYIQTMKFINSLERDKTFFLVNSIGLGEQQGGFVRLSITLESYLRGDV